MSLNTLKSNKFSGWFSSSKRPKFLLNAITILLGVGVIFYAGYELAIYQLQDNYNLLPHINFTKNTNSSCPSDEVLTLPDLPNATKPVCELPGIIDKPVIYLYPTYSEDVSVKVSYAGGLRKTVPAYNLQTGWQVLAQPSGTLTDLANGKSYPYLFWEGNPDSSLHFDMAEGFVVAGSDTKGFLQHQLSIMGLNQDETSAFIGYWLPRMEHNRYDLIHFAGSEYTNAAKLIISPQPNSLLRVFMAYKPLQSPVKVMPQTFPTFQRVGFTAVEWGGTELP